jgi:hypothetical protein
MATAAQMPRPGGAPGGKETTFTRNLKYEFADEEGRALMVSYGVSGLLGALWLLLVFFGPRTESPHLLPENEQGEIVVQLDPPETTTPPPPPAEGAAERVPAPGPTKAPPGPKGPTKGNPKMGAPGSRTEKNASGAIGDAFGTGSGSGTGGLVGDMGNVLRGTATNSGSGGSGGGLGGTGGGGTGGKVVLGYGQGGQGARTPGRGGIGGGSGTGGGGGGGIGGVGAGGGISAAPVRVAAPKAVDVPDIGRAGRSTDELGTFVRSREPQLRFCYQEFGLKANPSLAGSIGVSISLTDAGNVTNVSVTNRSWGGAGASEAENCIRGRIRSWRFPSGNEGTYGFSFNFTR